MDFDPSISDEERAFYLRAYPTIDAVREKKVHCTVCKIHIGTAVSQEDSIKMHPILRVTHCTKCHDFYNSGEFSKGEDGSELYCRWCGQGGEVYCCSDCPFVFCKSCITKNLSRGVVADIEQNENWRCFGCSPKILWPLRAQHWALIKFIKKQRKHIEAMDISEEAKQQEISQDRSTCCRLAKAKCGSMSDSLESLESATSRKSSGTNKKKSTDARQATPTPVPPVKRAKLSNDEVVCTPDLLSMLEPDCQITVPSKGPVSASTPQSSNATSSTPKVASIHQNYGNVRSSVPPPLVLRNTQVTVKQAAMTSQQMRRPASNAGFRTPSPGGPLFHTINGYRVDLNSASRQEHYRLPNGKLIQVRRSDANNGQPGGPQRPGVGVPMQNVPPSLAQRNVNVTNQQPGPSSRYVVQLGGPGGGAQQMHPQMVRYQNTVGQSPALAQYRATGMNGGHIQLVNGLPTVIHAPQSPGAPGQPMSVRPMLVKHTFPNSAIGQARTQLQDQIFNAMEICTHLTGKIHTLTNSNAYKQAKSSLEVKELYIHLSYLLTYAIGRFKGLQDKCLNDMRQLGFTNDADSLENGQLAAGVDYVRHSRLEDVEIFNTGPNSFHHQIHEYRKRLIECLYNDDDPDGNNEPQPPLSPLLPPSSLLGHSDNEDDNQETKDDDQQLLDGNDMTNDEYYESTIQPESFMESTMKEDFNDDDDENSMLGRSSVNESGSQQGNDDGVHSSDRKLARLIRKYPSIWCTRHPDYGNFEITRKYWRAIASNFKYSHDIKIRWKNLRKRFVRIERRTQEGKRFNGYFDKSLNFLANRDLPMESWLPVDCGKANADDDKENDDDDEDNESGPGGGSSGGPSCSRRPQERGERYSNFGDNSEIDPLSISESTTRTSTEPLDVKPLDLKIIQFVKSNPVLWRRSSDPKYDKMDDQTRKGLWLHFWRSMPNTHCEELVDRWKHLYATYKVFRLKLIKPEGRMRDLELKYSNYLAKLHFLYKIDDEELHRDNYQMEDYISSDTDEGGYDDDGGSEVSHRQKQSLLKMPDDKDFTLHLVRTIREYPQLWNRRHIDYSDFVARDRAWMTISQRLHYFGSNKNL